MVLWQFITLSTLVVGLLVYASVLTRRLGCTNARLKKIEELLLAKDRSIERTEGRAAESNHEVRGKDAPAGYLTIRDLRASSEQARLRAARSSSASAVAVASQELADATRILSSSVEVIPERIEPVAMTSDDADSATTSLESRDATEMLDELSSLPILLPASADTPATSSASQDAPNRTNGSQSVSVECAPSEDSVTKRDRDVQLILSSQRRRRRVRTGH